MAEVTQENGQERALSVEELGQSLQALEHHHTTTPFGDTREAARKLRRYIADLERRLAPLADEAQSEAKRLVKRVLDSGGEVLLPPSQWLLLARYAASQQVALPEDVARDVETVREGLDTYAPQSLVDTVLPIISRLASAAARVPGLVTWQEEMLHALGLGLDYTPTADKAVGILKGIISEVKELEQRCVTAESERDAARSETERVDRLYDEVAEALDAAGIAAREDGTQQAERVATLAAMRDAAREERDAAQRDLVGVINERDAARQEAEALRTNVSELDGKWREVMWQALGRDPAKEVGSMLILSREIAALTARVAELEADVGLHKTIREEAEARATAAEAKAAGLVKEAHHYIDLHNRDEKALALVRTPVEDVWRWQGGGEDNLESMGAAMVVVMTAGTLRGLLKPTPAPGLREAVGYALECLTAADAHPNVVSRLRAAYDGTAPATTPPKQWHCPACKRDVPDVEVSKNGRHISPKTFGGCSAAVVLKTNDAPEPSVTHAQLAAVVETYAEECTDVEVQGDAFAGEYAERVAGARELMRRVTGGEVPEVLPKARVVEVLTGLLPHGTQPPYGQGMDGALRQAAAQLGLTLPTAQGGEERCPSCEGRGYPGEIGAGRGGQGACPDCNGTGRVPVEASTSSAGETEPLTPDTFRDIGQAIRVRIAQTPPPEVPGRAWCEDNEHSWDTKDGDLPSDGRQEVRCTRCPAVATRMRQDGRAYRIPSSQKPVEEAAAPEVNGQSPALTACHPVPSDTARLALNGAYLVLDETQGEERARWEPVLRMLDEAFSSDAGGPAPLPGDAEALDAEVMWVGKDECDEPVRAMGDGTLQWQPNPGTWTASARGSPAFNPLERGLALALAQANRERQADTVRAAEVLVGVAKESAQLGAENMRRRMHEVLDDLDTDCGSTQARMWLQAAKERLTALPTLGMEAPAHG